MSHPEGGIMESKMVTMERLEARALLSGGAAAAGSLDQTFGRHGVSYVEDHESRGNGTAAAVMLPGGRTLVAGDVGVLMRFNADGSLDTSFGRGGYAAPPLADAQSPGLAPSAAVAMRVDGRGRVLVLSTTRLVRLNGDGSVDASFGQGGHVSLLDVDQLGDGRDVRVGPDGSIYVAAATADDTARFAVLKLTSHGRIDPSYGKNGLAITGFTRGGTAVDARADALAIDDQGRVVAGGGGDGYLDLARFNRDGTLDKSFGSGGRVQLDAGGADHGKDLWLYGQRFSSLAIDGDDGSIVAAGGTPAGGDDALVQQAGPLVVARFNSAGRLDRSFARGGVFSLKVSTSPHSSSAAEARGVMLQSNGGVVVTAGVTGSKLNGLVLMRLNGRGRIDRSFGTSLAPAPGTVAGAGVGYLAFDKEQAQPTAVAGIFPLHGGAFQVPVVGVPAVGVGNADDYAVGTPAGVQRFTANGNPDASFGTNGRAAVDYTTRQIHTLDGVYPLADGSVLTATTVFTGGHTPALHKLTAAGAVADSASLTAVATSLGENGIRAVLPDGRFVSVNVVGGVTGTVNVTRYKPDGSPDASFGTGGTVAIPVPAGATSVYSERLAVRPDGAMVVDVTWRASNGANDTLVLLDGHGATLGSVDVPGYASGFGPSSSLSSFDFAPDGSVVALTAAPGPGTEVRRFTAADLSPDASFGTGGAVTVGPAGVYGQASQQLVGVQPDGRVVLGTSTPDRRRLSRTLTSLTRLDASGAADPTFGDNGGVRVEGSTVLVQADGALLAVDRPASLGVMRIERLTADGAVDETFGDAGVSTLAFAGAQNFGPTLRLAETPDGEKLLVALDVTPRPVEPLGDTAASEVAVARVNL
jgi:uncharacterized delta-60 repeat protein